MIGVCRDTGKLLEGVEHVKPCIKDILTTRIGTRVNKYEYGSKLPEMVDSPITDSLVLEMIAETAGALRRWEKRVSVRKVEVGLNGNSAPVVTVYCDYLPNGSDIVVEVDYGARRN